MPAQPTRRFGEMDGMILVAAMAVASASILPAVGFLLDLDEEGVGPALQSGTLPGLGFKATQPLAAALTVAFLMIRLRRPRPRFPRLMRQPGMAAGIAAASAIMVGALMIPAAFALAGVPPRWSLYRHWFLPIFTAAGYAAGASWIVLALARVGRPEAGWIDRMGRALGLYWIVASLAMTWGAFLSEAVHAQFVLSLTPKVSPSPGPTPPASPDARVPR